VESRSPSPRTRPRSSRPSSRPRPRSSRPSSRSPPRPTGQAQPWRQQSAPPPKRGSQP
jgi:hypothetical protein